MKKYYAIDWMIEDNYGFDNKDENEQKRILLSEIENVNKIDNVNIELYEIENMSAPGGSTSIIIKASKDDMIKIGYAEEDIDYFEIII